MNKGFTLTDLSIIMIDVSIDHITGSEKGGEHMPVNEKEYNGNLFDQLSIIERIERHLISGGEEGAKAEIDILKKEINRKLYQKPPLTGNQT